VECADGSTYAQHHQECVGCLIVAADIMNAAYSKNTCRYCIAKATAYFTTSGALYSQRSHVTEKSKQATTIA